MFVVFGMHVLTLVVQTAERVPSAPVAVAANVQSQASSGSNQQRTRKQWTESERLVVLDTVRRIGSVDGAVRWLHIHTPATFSRLNESTVRGWFKAPRPGSESSPPSEPSGAISVPSSNGSGMFHLSCCF